MYISTILINNFRIFKGFEIQLNAGLNVVVGENNSGKTALIDAIRLTLDTNSSEWTKIYDFDFHENEEQFHIQIKFDDISPKQASVFVEHLTHEKTEGNGRRSVLYVNLRAQITNVIKRGDRYIRSELRSGANADGPMIEHEIREYLSATYLRPLRDAESELNAGRNSRLAQIISSSGEFERDGGNFQKLLEESIKASSAILNNDGLKVGESKIDGNLQKLIFNQDKFKLAIQILGSKDFSDMSLSEKERAFRNILQKLSLVLDSNKPLQGLGYNNVLFMATELLLLEQEKDEFPLLLIEEPEAHLHPQLQMKFLKFIRDEYSAPESPKLQAIITTHSPNLASKAPLDSITLMKDGMAFPMKRGRTGLESEDYVFLEKFLDVTKSNLFFAKGVLIVEGDAENILLPTISELLGHPFEDYGVSVVNVGSTAYARFAKIFLRSLEGSNDVAENWLNIPVACLRDLDLWPEKADKEIGNGAGFKELKEGVRGNEHFWLTRTNPRGEQIGTNPVHKKNWLSKLATKHKKYTSLTLKKQRLKVLVSDEWTFEYCLIRSGLDDIVCEALGGVENLPEDSEEKAIQIYKEIETKSGAKTDVAYKLCELLKRDFIATNKRAELLGKLPAYIKNALQHVLGLETLVIAEAAIIDDGEE
ncbi:MAG: AAA family ATPase [Colwellia sp.]|nr:AAA family ATPase [Colwellia sp.]